MMESYQDLSNAVAENDGLLKASMSDLKRIAGAPHLRAKAREEISEKLTAHGMGHLPQELPNCQGDEVRLYLIASPLGELVTAVNNPSDHRDDVLRAVGAPVRGSAADEQIRQIRQILDTSPEVFLSSEETPAQESGTGNPGTTRSAFGQITDRLPESALQPRTMIGLGDYVTALSDLMTALEVADEDLALAKAEGYRLPNLGKLFNQVAPDKPSTLKLITIVENYCSQHNSQWVLGKNPNVPADIRLFHLTCPDGFMHIAG